MSISKFFEKVRAGAAAIAASAKPSQHDLAVKAMMMAAEGAHRRKYGPRRPKRNIHVGQVSQVGETEHRLPPRKGVHLTAKVPLLYQLMVDGSRYALAHDGGGGHPGWKGWL